MTKQNNKGVRAFYDSAGEYFSVTRKWLWPEMLPYLNTLEENDTVLDIGCGNGRLLNGLKTKINYYGVDFSGTLLTQAKKLHPNHRFITGDITKPEVWKSLPKSNALFCVAVVHHIRKKDLSFLFDQFAEHLKKGGMLYLSTWNLWQSKYLRYHFTFRSLMTKIQDRDFRSVWVPFQSKYWRYCQAYTLADMQKQAKMSGLRIEKLEFAQGPDYKKAKNILLVLRK